MNAHEWLRALAIFSLTTGGLCFVIVLGDILAGHRQRMRIMNVVWPVTMLYSGPLGLWFYFKAGRKIGEKPLWQTVGVATTHCGSGCTLGDICAESIGVMAPMAIFGHSILGDWTLDYILAFAFGIGFQYFTIKPMRRNLSVKEALMAALKADTLSLTAWQVGMYGWMAITTYLLFGHELPKTKPLFWFMMQIAMLVGFITSYPVNLWLVNQGIKEKM